MEEVRGSSPLRSTLRSTRSQSRRRGSSTVESPLRSLRHPGRPRLDVETHVVRHMVQRRGHAPPSERRRKTDGCERRQSPSVGERERLALKDPMTQMRDGDREPRPASSQRTSPPPDLDRPGSRNGTSGGLLQPVKLAPGVTDDAVPPLPPPLPPPPVFGVRHPAPVMVLLSRVTPPVCARARPSRAAPVCSWMLVLARIFPSNTVPIPSVAELTSRHHTLQGSPPTTLALPELEVMSVAADLKIQTPDDPLRVSVPDNVKASAQYTPGTRLDPTRSFVTAP